MHKSQGLMLQTITVVTQRKFFQLFYYFFMVWTGPLGSKIQSRWPQHFKMPHSPKCPSPLHKCTKQIIAMEDEFLDK